MKNKTIKGFFRTILLITPMLFVVFLTKAQTANFSYSVLNSNCVSAQVQLTDLSSGNITLREWFWQDEFGQTQTSTLQNPVITVWQNNSNVELRLNGSYSLSNHQSVIVPSVLCDTLSFTPFVADECTTSVYLENHSNYSYPVYYEWSTNAPFVYNNNYWEYPNEWFMDFPAGTYDITLSVYSDSLMTNLVDSETQSVSSAFIHAEADFDYALLNTYCDYSKIQLIEISTNNPITWNWNWIDNNGNYQTSNLQNPVINLGTGATNVSLSVGDSTGCYDYFSDSIVVHGNALSVSLQDSIISQTCDSTTIQFYGYNASATSYTWYFHDGQTASIAEPLLTFSNSGLPGFADVTISDGSCTVTDSLYIAPVTNVFCDTVSFNIVDNSYCDSIQINFNNTSNPSGTVFFDWDIPGLVSPNYYQWNNNIYAYDFTPGSYDITLSMYADAALTQLIDSEIQSFTFTASGNTLNADMSYDILSTSCSGAQVQFTDLSFGNPVYWEWYAQSPISGGQTSHQQNPIFSLNSGTNMIQLLVLDSAGCSAYINDVVIVNGNSLSANIQDSIISQTCDSTTIQFYGFDVSATSYAWYFQDGQTATAANPVLTFSNSSLPGFADLSISDGTCTASDSLYIADYSCSIDTACGHILTLEDSYGDGWNGNSLNAYVNGVFFNNYTFTFGSAQTFPIALNTGDQISFVWDNSGNWSNECSWSFANASGNVVLDLASPLATANIGSYTAFCNDFSTVINSSLDSMINCTNSIYTFSAAPNGGAAPYTFVWTYDGNTYTGNNVSIATTVNSNTISLEVTDINGLLSNENYFVSTLQALSLNINTTTPTCDSSNYLYAYAYPSGGSGNYSYLWSNGVTDYSISSGIDGITLGSYSLIVTDNVTGCTVSGTANLYDACYSISGTVYVDYNGNCVVDGNDHPLSNSYYVDLTGSNTSWGDFDYVSSADNGHYFIEDVAIGTYGLDVNGNNVNSYIQNCPNASFTVTVDAANPNPTVDIFMTPPAPSQDLSVSLYSQTTFTPGFPYWAYASYCNDGTISMSGSVVMSYDAELTYIAGSSNPDVVDAVNNILTWNFTNLQAGQCVSLFPDFTTSTTAVLGSMMSNTIIVNPIAGDVTPANNSAYVMDSVVGSWDPNDKSVFPAGNISPEQKDHSYHINFQNEGNGPATLVVVRDNLDDNLDIQTLRNVSASHNFVMTIENTDELVFTFNNIYLTPKDIDEPNSKGHIDFTISQHEDLPLGTIIENTAEIYFDFNEAIITNTTVNTIVEKSTGIKDVDVSNEVNVYPNPSNGLLNISLENNNDLELIEVFDVLGKLIFSASDLSETAAIVNLQNTSAGMYLIKVSTKNGLASERIVISK